MEMPTDRRDWYLNAQRDAYLNALTNRKAVTKSTTDEYGRLITLATKAWRAAGLEPKPKKVGEEEINLLRHELYSHLSPTVNRRQVSIIGQYLKFHGNNIVERLMIPWPPNTRPNAKWLSDEEGLMLLDAARDPLEKMLVHLELRLMLRRVEVIRLTVKDVEMNILKVRGKGRLGGKWRTLAWAPDTLSVIQEYSMYREELIKNALEVKPDQTIPENIMIYAQYGWKLGSYQETAIDSMVKEVGIHARIKPEDVSNHVLRRTGCRIHRHAGVEIEDLSAAMGHVSPQQTIQYAGLSVDDLAKAQWKVESYLEDLRRKMSQEPWRAMPQYRPTLIAR